MPEEDVFSPVMVKAGMVNLTAFTSSWRYHFAKIAGPDVNGLSSNMSLCVIDKVVLETMSNSMGGNVRYHSPLWRFTHTHKLFLLIKEK